MIRVAATFGTNRHASEVELAGFTAELDHISGRVFVRLACRLVSVHIPEEHFILAAASCAPAFGLLVRLFLEKVP